MRYPLQIVDKLYREERRFNLRHFTDQQISIKLGTLVFGLIQNEESMPLLTLVTQDLEKAELNDLVDRSVGLEPGGQLLIGRNLGLSIVDSQGNADMERVEALGGDILSASLRQIDSLSREHARVTIIDPWTIKIKDQGSTNKTYVLGVPQSPETLRAQLKLVE